MLSFTHTALPGRIVFGAGRDNHIRAFDSETGKQLSLGQRARQERQLREAIQQLKTRYGHSPVYRCVDVEPWSVIPEDRQILVESDA